MSERPSDMTPGDPLGDPEAPRHDPGLPGAPERPVAATPPADQLGTAPPADQLGYSSAPPPGAVGGGHPLAAGSAAFGRQTLAGWWPRVAAQLIDGLILTLGWILITLLFGAVFSVGFFASGEAGAVSLIVGLLLSFVAFAIAALVYAPLMMSRTNGQTLGRMALGIRVVRAKGEPMTFGWAMLREVAVKWLLFGAVLSSFTFGLAWLLDVLWPLWDDENRALHDFVVDTRVVRAQ